MIIYESHPLLLSEIQTSLLYMRSISKEAKLAGCGGTHPPLIPALGRQRRASGPLGFQTSQGYLVRLLCYTTKSQNQKRICDGVKKPDPPTLQWKNGEMALGRVWRLQELNPSLSGTWQVHGQLHKLTQKVGVGLGMCISSTTHGLASSRPWV